MNLQLAGQLSYGLAGDCAPLRLGVWRHMAKIIPNGEATLDALRARPGALIGPAELAGAGIVRNYTSLNAWIARGALPPPVKLPGGFLRWRAGDVLDKLGLAAPAGDA